jgi:hypothetical protein
MGVDMRRLFLVAPLCLACSIGHAETTGNALKEYCSFYPQHNEAAALCAGYIGGTLDMARGVDKALKLQMACQPKGVTGDQLIAMVIKYLADHPEQLHYDAASLIWEMYTKAFPCSKNSN